MIFDYLIYSLCPFVKKSKTTRYTVPEDELDEEDEIIRPVKVWAAFSLWDTRMVHHESV